MNDTPAVTARGNWLFVARRNTHTGDTSGQVVVMFLLLCYERRSPVNLDLTVLWLENCNNTLWCPIKVSHFER